MFLLLWLLLLLMWCFISLSWGKKRRWNGICSLDDCLYGQINALAMKIKVWL
jgi:hypothetical protein